MYKRQGLGRRGRPVGNLLWRVSPAVFLRDAGASDFICRTELCQLSLRRSAFDLRAVDPGGDRRGADPVSYTHLDVYKRQHSGYSVSALIIIPKFLVKE